MKSHKGVRRQRKVIRKKLKSEEKKKFRGEVTEIKRKRNGKKTKM